MQYMTFFIQADAFTAIILSFAVLAYNRNAPGGAVEAWFWWTIFTFWWWWISASNNVGGGRVVRSTWNGRNNTRHKGENSDDNLRAHDLGEN
jgi:hypothetical protein